jgi:BirA family biotin operon repressor/biotin-[acetyl-CoA-carboxylase] ligase
MNDTRRALLGALHEGPASGPELAERLGVSRAAVWKHIEALRDAGFEIGGGDGYRVESVPDYGAAAVAYGLDAPFEIEYHDAIDSTNRRARELAAAGAADTAVLAAEQTGGRGRLEREWDSPEGGLWTSLVLRPDLPPARVSLLTLAAAVAVTDAAREAGVDARIKWPNDVIVPGADGDRKLAGVLTELRGEADRAAWAVVGCGVNVNVDAADLPEGATSVRAAAGDVPLRAFCQRVFERFHELRSDPDGIVEAWRERAATLGREVRVETGTGEVVGEAIDVTDAGALVVRTEGGERTVHAGDCEHLRPV